MDLTTTIIPKSDQLNADDLLPGPRTFSIEKVEQGDSQQPVNIHLSELPGRPYKPNKSMRRVLVAIWGAETSVYAGRGLTLYRAPEVKWAGEEVGGIKISHLSDMDKPVSLSLTVNKSSRAKHTVQPLTKAKAQTKPTDAAASRASKAAEWFAGKGVVQSSLEAHVGKSIGEWSIEDVDELKSNSAAIVAEVAGGGE